MSGPRHLGAVILLAMVCGLGLSRYPAWQLGPSAIYTHLALFLPRQIGEFWRPGTGEWVLPPAVQQALALLRAHAAKSYRTSPRIKGDPLHSQRLTEGAWPIRADPAAAWYVALAGEAIPPDCSLVEDGQEALLARCPRP